MGTGPKVWTATAATRVGDRLGNQDRVVVVDGAVAVLDGATSWLPQDPHRDGGWYAQMLAAALTRRLPGHPEPLAALLSDAIAEMRDTYDLDPDLSPYSTATLVRWSRQTVDALVLGDSPLVVFGPHPMPTVLADDRLEPIGAPQREKYRAHLRAGNGFDEAFRGLIADVQTVERQSRNRPGGFWVAGALPEAAHHGIEESWPASGVTSVMGMTDGMAAAVTDYHMLDWKMLHQQVEQRGPAAVISTIHEAETQDPDGRRWPRTKRHDDKSLVLLTY